jgi:hypothetical protein
MTTIHSIQLPQSQKITNNNTPKTTNNNVQKAVYTTQGKIRKNCLQLLVIFSTLIALTLSPQPITSHHFAIHMSISHKLAFFFLHSLLCTTLHFSSNYFTTLLDAFHFTKLLDDFHLATNKLYCPRTYPLHVNNCFLI